MANNRKYRKIYWRFSSSSQTFRRIYIRRNRSHGNLVNILQSSYILPQRSGRNRIVLNYSGINTGAMINERDEISVTDERNRVTNGEVRSRIDSGPNNLTLPSHSLMDAANVSDVHSFESNQRNSNPMIQSDSMRQFSSTTNFIISAFLTGLYADSPSISSLNGGRNRVTNEEVRNRIDSGSNRLTLPLWLTDAANVPDVDMNLSESNERNSNSFIQTDPMHQFLSTRNCSVSASPTYSYADSSSMSSVNFGREANINENNFIFSPNRAVRNSSTRHRFTTTVNAEDIASYMAATSEAPSTSNSRSENLEQTFVNSYQGNEDQSSSAKCLITTNFSNQAENSEAGALVCPVCLEHFDKLLNNGDHFVAVTCGHVFCNKCADVFKGFRKCPKCRAYISARKILRLHF